jgi:hypothetical protein
VISNTKIGNGDQDTTAAKRLVAARDVRAATWTQSKVDTVFAALTM